MIIKSEFSKCKLNFYLMSSVIVIVTDYNFNFSDGSTQQLAGCLRDFRNKPFPVRAKVTYYKNVLTVSTSSLTRKMFFYGTELNMLGGLETKIVIMLFVLIFFQIYFNNGMSNTENDFELCMRVENVYLPSRGYYGLSAATGGLAGRFLEELDD